MIDHGEAEPTPEREIDGPVEHPRDVLVVQFWEMMRVCLILLVLLLVFAACANAAHKVMTTVDALEDMVRPRYKPF